MFFEFPVAPTAKIGPILTAPEQPGLISPGPLVTHARRAGRPQHSSLISRARLSPMRSIVSAR